jgi:hypothetical protein
VSSGMVTSPNFFRLCRSSWYKVEIASARLAYQLFYCNPSYTALLINQL